MEPQKQMKYSSKISQQSRKSNRSSCRSLGRSSWSDREHSLSKNRSLIQVMSLERSKKSSDLYEKMLAEDVEIVERPVQKQYGSGFNPFKTCFKVQEMDDEDHSHVVKVEIEHICLCYRICNYQRCPCFSYPQQMCQEDLCCKQCIEAKKKKVQRSAVQIQQNRQWCTCKKTKCKQKYCTCYAAGVKCGEDCSCEDCLNCDKKKQKETGPKFYGDEQLSKLEMPQNMDFQPFVFRPYYNS